MSGCVSGVAKRFKDEEPAALYIHCLAHSLNLRLQDACRYSTIIRNSIDLVMAIVKLVKYSPKRSALFNAINGQVLPDVQNLIPLCPMRWAVRTGVKL